MGHFKGPRVTKPKTFFFLVFVLTFFIKLWLAYVVPVTGDEALFYWWGTFPSLGYYDHPPMVGWMIAVLKPLGESPIILRLPTVAITFVIALGIVDLVGRLSPDTVNRKWAIATMYLLTPITWFGVPVTNDTPLMLFTFGSVYCFLRGEFSGPPRGETRSTNILTNQVWLVLSGLFLGLAFLSKYLAVVLAISFAVVLLADSRDSTAGVWARVRKLFIIFCTALPFALLNLTYNMTNCWNNVMFNAINRHDDAEISLRNLLLYVVMVTYLVTPWLLVWVWRARQHLRQTPEVLLLAVLPFGVFLLLSFTKTIGLHWVLGFLPMVFVLCGTRLQESQLRIGVRWSGIFAIPHVIFIVGLLGFSNVFLSYPKFSAKAGFVFDAPALAGLAMQGAAEGTVLMAEGYSPGAVIGYYAKQYVPVFGVGSRYARQDDCQVDFREFDGRSIRIFLTKERQLSDYSPYFDKIGLETLQVSGRSYWVVHGDGFRFATYRERVIQEIYSRYYQIPSFLPMFGCPFIDRYGLRPLADYRN